ncbi:MAG: hypothetical protein IKZ84_10215, partial [Victivallales bacterium]|nr:hypothetical protein [Victivallales bacterium]
MSCGQNGEGTDENERSDGFHVKSLKGVPSASQPSEKIQKQPYSFYFITSIGYHKVKESNFIGKHDFSHE